MINTLEEALRYIAELEEENKVLREEVEKHKTMIEKVDFIKIKDYAVINLNNMIPVPNSQVIDIDINKEKDSSYRY